jgi:hypothetical protein
LTFSDKSLEFKHKILTVYGPFREIALFDITTCLEHVLSLALPPLLEPSSNGYKSISFHVIQHHHIRTSIDGFVSFRLRADLDIY